jgi:hypothetical protein
MVGLLFNYTLSGEDNFCHNLPRRGETIGLVKAYLICFLEVIGSMVEYVMRTVL